jgi:hypothetical protein
MKPTELFSNPDLLKNARKELYQKNIKFLVNYYYLIKDKDHHLWLNMAYNPDSFICFRSVKTGVSQIKEIIKEISSHSMREEIPEFVLEIFRKYGWIETKFEKLSYELLISSEENRIEMEIMKEIYEFLKNRNIIKKVKKKDQKFYLI